MNKFNTIITDSEINGSLCICDTETTGFSNNDYLIEIAILKVLNKKPIGTIHYYIDPGENVFIPDEAAKVHGITNEKMAIMRNNYQLLINNKHDEIQYQSDTNIAYPLSKVWYEIVDTLNTGIFIAHNAKFDSRFINNTNNRAVEAGLLDKLKIKKIVDTIAMYKIINPTGKANLDILCERYNVDKTSRNKYHGALIDTHLLFDVFLKMIDNNENDSFLDFNNTSNVKEAEHNTKKRKRTPLIVKPTSEEYKIHNDFISKQLNKN